MAEASPRQSALADICPTGRLRCGQPEDPHVVLEERRNLTLVHLTARPEPGVLDGVQRGLGLALPLAPNTVARGDTLSIFWLGPGRWLVESGSIAPPDLERRLRDDLGGQAAEITDVSGGRAVMRIAGDGARWLLAKGCPIDLHPKAFPPGAVAHTMLEGVTIMLHAPDVDALDLYVGRSYGRHVWEWLVHAAHDLG
jgi:sarcosine oxidase subunit gamma